MKESVRIKTRLLRKRQTECEVIVWDMIRNRKLNGIKFLRQHPISFDYFGESRNFIADFYSRALKLVIEIDGGIHETLKDYDKYRDYIMSQKGLNVLRFSNEDVLNKMENVQKAITYYLQLHS